MLRRMAKMVPKPAVHGVQTCEAGRHLVPASALLKRFRWIHLPQRELILLDVKWSPGIWRRDRLVHLRGQCKWTYNCGSNGIRRYAQHAFHEQKSIGGRASYRRSTARICPDGEVDLSPSKPISVAETAQSNVSLRSPSIAIHNETLVKAIVYEARTGCINVAGKTKRFSDFLVEEVTASAENDHLGLSLEIRKALWSLSLEGKLYEKMEKRQRVSLLSKVARSLGFTSLQDLITYDIAAREAGEGLQPATQTKIVPNNESDSLNTNPATGRFSVNEQQNNRVREPGRSRVFLRQVPGIKYGSSEPIKLPNEFVKCVPAPSPDVGPDDPTGSTSELGKAKRTDSDLSESFHSGQGNGRVYDDEVAEEGSNGVGKGSVKKAQNDVVHSAPAAETLKSSASKPAASVKGASNLKHENLAFGHATEAEELSVPKTVGIDEKWGLDMPISLVKALSAPLRGRLEENNFHTVRLLLQHFPRMYQNYQQAGQRVEDGQNLSFVGVVVQSRGAPRGFSLGLVEVIVRSEVDEFSLDDPPTGVKEGLRSSTSDDGRTGRTVFLHLKRFFKGSRYTSLGFLNAIAKKYPENAQVTVCGKVKELPQRDHFEIREFNIELWDGTSGEDLAFVSPSRRLDGGKPYPVYPMKGSLQPSTIEFCIQRVLPLLYGDLDPIPKGLRDKLQIQELHEAYKGIHSPAQASDAEVARHRLVFDEFFYLQLGMLLLRQEVAGKNGPGVDLADVLKVGFVDTESWSPLTLKLLKSLPYTLTNSQIKAAGEVIWDLRRPLPMSRLLQGDVGCGKTIVALLALVEVLDAGYQGALMAPTEFLAIQHYQRISSWLETLDEDERPRVALLTGSTTLSKARAIRRGFETGEIRLAIGTHSLISDSVKFSALKLAVIDEQHRFGVLQRGRLNSKVRDAVHLPESSGGGEGDVHESISIGVPHILAMSATPIPRTLALAMHGDMSLSQVMEIPPGRAETTTYAIHGDKKGRERAYKRVREELESGGRVFVVFPVIEESEEIPDVRAAETEFKNLEVEFKEFRLGLVHGRMKSHEKDEAMERFKSGETQVLVSTTVIEVGIDIPEASMIVVEHAERYGMAQLHQLRGRVGRGSRASSCILLGSRASSLARLKLLETSRDGFYLAAVDLQQRGPGDMLGKRQSGYLPEFNIARLEKDGEILEKARTAAEELVVQHPMLKGLPRIRHELNMRRPPFSLS